MKLSKNIPSGRNLATALQTMRTKQRANARLTRATSFTIATVGTMVAGLFTIPSGYGATITSDGNDPAGTSSFNSGANWTGGQAPVAGNDYIVNGGDQIRTPTTGTLFTFAGNSLTLGDGTTTGYGILTFKGQIGDTLTINNFTLNSGIIQSGGTSAGTANPWTLASAENITVGSGGFAIDNGGVAGRTVTIAPNLVGSGGLEVISNSRTAATATNSINGGTLFLTGSNSLWTGTLLIEGGALQIGNGGAAGTLGTGAIDVDNVLAFDVTTNQTYTQSITNDASQTGTISNLSTGSITLAGVTVNGTLNVNNAAGALNFSGPITENAANAFAITNTTGTVGLAGGIAGGGGAITVANGGGAVNIGAITGTGSFTVSGTGTTFLTGSNTYNGNTAVNGGSLVVTSTGKVPASNNWTVGSGAILDVSQTTGAISTNSSGSISGSGTIVANSSGVTSQGQFSPGNGATVGTLTVNGHLTFTGGTINTTLNAASTSTGNDMINVTGTGAGLTLNGTIFLNPTFVGGTPSVGSEYELIGYTGSLSGSGAIVPQSRSIQVITTTPGEIIAEITTSAAANLVWNSTSNQNWDIVNTANWHNSGTNQNDVFYQGDNVTFNDSVSGVQPNINIAAQVAPGSVTVNSTANNYVFGGSGGISGGTALNVTLGTNNSLTITASNSYTGGTNINSGVVQIGNGSGSNTSGNLGTGTVNNNGTLLFARSDAPLISNTITGNGGLEFGNASGSIPSGGGTLAPTGTSTFTGGTVVNSGTVFPSGPSAFGAASSTVTINNNGQVFSVAANGTYDQPVVLNGLGPNGSGGVLHAGGSTISTFSGNVSVISDSIITVDGGATLALTGTNALTSNNGSLVEAAGSGALGLGGNLNLGSGGELFAGTVVLMPAAGMTNTLSSPIADNSPSVGTLNENGATTGTTVLAVDNSYSGTTTITNGILEPQSANAIPSSSTIFIVGNGSTGALGLTGIGVTTISNTFAINGRPNLTTYPDIINISGNNTITGTMTGNTGGTFYPIESDAGTLTVSGTLAMGGATTGMREISLQGSAPGVGNWTGNIVDGTSTITVSKNGTGTWLLSNSMSYSGGTIISGGTLVVNAASGALGSGNVTMDGGTLASTAGASDTVGGSVVDGATAAYTIAPGGVGTVGTLSIGGLTTSNLGTLSFQLGSGSSVNTNGSVLLMGSGTVSIGAGTLIAVTGTPTLGDNYRIFGGTISGIEADENDFVLPQVGNIGFQFNNSIDPGFIDLKAIVGGPPSLTWNDASADNLWNTSSDNWNSSSNTTTSYSNGALVTFNDNNGGNYSVTLNTTVSPGSVTVNNSSANYTISGTGNIAGTGSLTKSGSANLTLKTVNTYSGGTNVSAGTLVVGVNGALSSGAVKITGGTLQLAASTGLATITSLSISGGGTFDVNNNHVIINYGSGTDPIASIAALLKSGYNSGGWNGANGITSTAASANSTSYGLGYADSADTGNPANLASGTIEIKYTLLGDADLSGVVDGTDFGIVAANFNKGVTGWDKGDFNYDNTVDGTDFGDLAANFNKGASGGSVGLPAYDDPAIVAFAEANGLMADLTSIPEPATTALITLGGIGVLSRRRRRIS